MSQIKYLVKALLLLLLFAILYVFVSKVLSTEIIDRRTVAIDAVVRPDNNTATNSQGHNLFSTNCATCHALDKIITGPALRGIESRGPWIDRKNVTKWVHNPAAMIPKFAYTRDLAAQFGGQIMPSFTDLSDAQIEAILDYIKTAQPVSYMPVVVVN